MTDRSDKPYHVIIGELLLEVRERLDARDFRAWLKTLPFSEETAARYMAAARQSNAGGAGTRRDQRNG